MLNKDPLALKRLWMGQPSSICIKNRRDGTIPFPVAFRTPPSWFMPKTMEEDQTSIWEGRVWLSQLFWPHWKQVEERDGLRTCSGVVSKWQEETPKRQRLSQLDHNHYAILNMNMCWIIVFFSEFYNHQCIEYKYFLNYKALDNIFDLICFMFSN